MSNDNYVLTHLHTFRSLLDSVTSFNAYVDHGAELGMKAIACTEHGNIYNWIKKSLYAKEKGLKYLHGCEVYLTKQLEPKIRDNMHTILIAKNAAGVQELNRLVSISNDKNHFYYKPRLSFDEFTHISPNIITTSACLAGPLNNIEETDPWFDELLRRYDYLEVQPHENSSEQKFLNQRLADIAKQKGIPLICGTDTHALSEYEAECRKIVMARKHIIYAAEDEFDLTMHSYDEVKHKFELQGVLNSEQIDEAMNSTNEVADMCDEIEIDRTIKYPVLHGSVDENVRVYHQTVDRMLEDKINDGTIPEAEVPAFRESVAEENRVFEKIGMCGFMLFMHETIEWCHNNGIITGPGRGSVSGSRIAYVLDITDVDSEKFQTIFSRFANENRVEQGDIDTDVCPDQQELVFNHIIKQFGQAYTSYIITFGTIANVTKAVVEICGALSVLWRQEHLHSKEISQLKAEIDALVEDKIIANKKENLQKISEKEAKVNELKKADEKEILKDPYSITRTNKIKAEFDTDEEKASKAHPEIAKYIRGLIGVPISQSRHPAGIVISPETIEDHVGTFTDSTDKVICQCDMDDIHYCNYVKLDILGLQTLQIIRDTFRYLDKPVPRTANINFEDKKVWNDLVRNPVGMFQFESAFAYQGLRRFEPKSIQELAILTAALRPTAASYRDDLLARNVYNNPSKALDVLFSDTFGRIIFQEDITRFLTDICGFTGSEADSVRRAIGHKDAKAIDKAMPQILKGYVSHSDKTELVATEEAEEFMQVIEDSASYGFNKGHAVSYSINTYMCAYLRCYYPLEFITSYFNNAKTQEDIANATDLAKEYGIRVESPKFGYSKDEYIFNKDTNGIYKGVASIKYCNKSISKALYELYFSQNMALYSTFWRVLKKIFEIPKLDTRQVDILIKVGYFSQYGNIATLLTIYQAVDELKFGEIKSINKDSIPDCLSSIDLNLYATDVLKTGNIGKTWNVKDSYQLLDAVEAEIRAKDLHEVGIKEQIKWQKENLGYVAIASNNKEDLRKLFINKVTPMVGQYNNGKPWCFRLDVTSIGTGHSATIYAKKQIWDCQRVEDGDVIYIAPGDLVKNNKGYWNVSFYRKIS